MSGLLKLLETFIILSHTCVLQAGVQIFSLGVYKSASGRSTERRMEGQKEGRIEGSPFVA